MSRRDGSTSTTLVFVTMASSIIVGGLLVAVCLGLLAGGGGLSALTTAGLSSVSALGFVIVTINACRVLRRVAPGASGGEGGEEGWGRGGPGPNPTPRPPSSDEPDWWPQFERDLRAYLEAYERVPVAG